MTREERIERLQQLGGVLDRQIATAIASGVDEEEMGSLYMHNVGYDQCTCADCGEVENCKYAWDPYNTDGSCLAGK